MSNLTEDGNYTTDETFYCSLGISGKQEIIYLSTLNILISITAFLGNALIIVALQKVSSVHSSSKLLLRCLVCTDLCVGLILQPLYITYLLSSENSKYCYYFELITYMVAAVFCGVSLSTLTAISVDRLLALLLGIRYRHVVTLRRVQVLVVLFWLCNTATAMTYLYNDILTVAIVCTGLLLCLVTSIVCYTKIYMVLHHHHTHVQVHDDEDQEESNRVGTRVNIGRYKKTVSSAIWVQLALVFCYLPFGIATIAVYLSETYSPCLALVWELTFSLLMLNSAINPMLYCWKIRGVRQAVKEIIRKLFCPVKLTVLLA